MRSASGACARVRCSIPRAESIQAPVSIAATAIRPESVFSVTVLCLRPKSLVPPMSLRLRSTVASSAKLRYRALCPLHCHVVIRQASQQHTSLDASTSTSPPALVSTPVLKSSEPQHAGGKSSKPDGAAELSDQEWEIRTGMFLFPVSRSAKV